MIFARRPEAAAPSEDRQQRGPVKPFQYEVQAGETPQEIAARFETDLSELLWNNGLDRPDQVKTGALLTILPVRGVLHHVRDGETLEAIAKRYSSSLDDIIVANAFESPGGIVPGQMIVVAGGRVPMPAAQAKPNAGSVRTTANRVAPTAAPTTRATPVSARATPAPAEPSRADGLPLPPGTAPWQRDFIMSVALGARESQRTTGVPASVTLAQAILESDWGRSKLTREANNLFGIKALRGPGSAGVYEIHTDEVFDGQVVTVMAAFKAYTSLADSIVDHGRWFHENSRYREALRVRDDPRAFARAINAAGYATDPAYAPKVIGLMDRFNLYAYDVRPGR
jgi:flagellum-specific peptidoglycan hydrolase FlgJ